MQLSKGQKIPLNENFITIRFERPTSALEIDTAAFLTQAPAMKTLFFMAMPDTIPAALFIMMTIRLTLTWIKSRVTSKGFR